MTHDRPSPAERLLVDARLGVLTAAAPQPVQDGLPATWVGYGAQVAATETYAPYIVDRYGFGAAIGNPDAARRAAVGEAVERYCGNIIPDRLPVASYTDWVRSGQRAIDPEELALYSPAQYATSGFPFVPFTRTLPVAWTRGRCLHDGDPILVPASLVYLNYYTGPRRSEPPTNALGYAGIAAGADRAHAERFALEELFERDASTLWWAAGAPSALITDAARVTDRLHDGRWPGVEIRLRQIPSSFGVPVVGAFLEDPGRRVIAFGSAARAEPVEAATKALVEALGLLAVTIKLTDPDSDVWAAVAEGTVPGHVYRAFRADRQYRDSFRPDLRDLVDLPALAQLYLDPRMQGHPLDRLRAPEPTTTFDEIPAVGPDATMTHYLGRVADAGLRAVSVDITTADIGAAGLRVVRVVVPGMYGNAPPAFPLHGGRRLRTEPVARGWTDQPLTDTELLRPPLPLA